MDLAPELSYSDIKYVEALHHSLSQRYTVDEVNVVMKEVLESIMSDSSLPDLSSLHNVIKHCRRCPTVEPEPTLPQWNYLNPDLVIVNETMTMSPEASKILVSGLKESGWSSDKCSFTALVRCPLGSNRAAYSTEISTCKTYLDYEIQIWKPKLTIALGLKTAEYFLGTNVKLSGVKGRIFWLGPWAILPTVSPTHILTDKSDKNLMAEMVGDFSKALEFCYGSS